MSMAPRQFVESQVGLAPRRATLTGMADLKWPLFGLRIRCRAVGLRPVREDDLPLLASIQPDDYEHDPGAEMLPGMDLKQNRARLVYQEYWRSLGTWSPSTWRLDLAGEVEGANVGVQTLEAEKFHNLRKVDSGSRAVYAMRGRG